MIKFKPENEYGANISPLQVAFSPLLSAFSRLATTCYSSRNPERRRFSLLSAGPNPDQPDQPGPTQPTPQPPKGGGRENRRS
jgi:hypothetical protein